MATKRSKKKRPSSKRSSSPPPEVQESFWKRVFLLNTIIPLVLGLLLIAGALVDIVVLWGSALEQGLLGGALILASFAASNALEKKWSLAIGWALLAPTVWLVGQPELWVRVVAYILGGLGLFFLSREFMRRFWEQEQRKARK